MVVILKRDRLAFHVPKVLQLARQPQESKSLAGASSGEFQLGRDSLELGYVPAYVQ